MQIENFGSCITSNNCDLNWAQFLLYSWKYFHSQTLHRINIGVMLKSTDKQKSCAVLILLKAFNKAKKTKSGKPQLSPEAVAMQQMMRGIHF